MRFAPSLTGRTGNPTKRRWTVTWLWGAACLACVGALLSGCGASKPAPQIRPRQSSNWTFDQGAIVRGDASQRKLALIFTGGEHGEGSEHILDTLKRRGVKASFFVTGHYLANPGHHPFVRRMVAEGHYLGPHSDSHPLYCSWEDRSRTLVSEAFFKEDLRDNIDELRRFGALALDRGDLCQGLADGQPIHFIPPFEWFNEQQVAWAREMGVVLFNFTPGSGSNRDWIPEGHERFVPSSVILRDILAYERRAPHGLNGFLLLLHLGSLRADKMHEQLDALLDELSRRGYEFVRVDEMLSRAGLRKPH